MKIHRFISSFRFGEKEFEIRDKEIVDQVRKVLRLKEGEFLELSDGKDTNTLVKIKKIEKDNILVEIEKTWQNEKQVKNQVALFCAVLKKENFELVVQKATECGVSKIFPIITERTIKTGLNIERLKKIAKEASEQSGRSDIPEISEPISFDKSLEISKGESFIFSSSESSFKEHGYFSAEKFLVLAPSRSQGTLKKDLLPEISIFIGPEGGWTEKEIEKAKAQNFKIASLGNLTFRAETAAIISTYLAVNM